MRKPAGDKFLVQMIDKVKNTIQKQGLVYPGEKIIVALSGGPDSVALLDVLAQIAPQMNLQLIVGHFNHGLRGSESDEDEKYCRRLAEKYRLPFFGGKMDRTKRLKGESPEDFYRRQRYIFLDGVARSNQAQKIAFGHNLQDQAQTILLRLVRGSSPEGLKGIPPVRENRFIRPLIDVSRGQIIEYLNSRHIPYRKDSSNENRRFLRNRIREDLVPLLKREFNPRIEENLARTAQVLRREDDFIKGFVSEAIESPFISREQGGFCLNVDYVRSLHPAVRGRLLKVILDEMYSGPKGLSYVHINCLEEMIQLKKSGKMIHLPGRIKARLEYGRLILAKQDLNAKKLEYAYPITTEGSFYIREKGVNVCLQKVSRDYIDYKAKNKVYMDLAALQPPLLLRNRRKGDWFEPMGAGGRKKLKDFFIDQKVPRTQRDDIMLIVDAVSVVWVEKMRLSERVKITDQTKSVLEVRIVEAAGYDS
ncbi:MAG TPA: tRNA lysidine(34) synthetase TilS [Smithellaceae bacterium]|nr:tRNA lysidine(34) synthetase TilS [Smithellaceae bacterium]HQG96185.1 tRNA lysidine(34) synthetase TilS [Smithellaceae bacterium]